MKKKLIGLLAIVLLVTPYYLGFYNELILDFQNFLNQDFEISDSRFEQKPIYVASKEDAFYFISSIQKPKVAYNGDVLITEKVDFDEIEIQIPDSLQDTNYLYEVRGMEYDDQSEFLNFMFDEYSLDIKNPKYFNYNLPYVNDSTVVEVVFNQNIAKNFEDYLELSGSLKHEDFQVDINRPGVLLVETKDWLNMPFKITLKPGFFDNYKLEQSLVLSKSFKGTNFYNRFQFLSFINQKKNSINYYVDREEEVNLSLYKIKDYNTFKKLYLEDNPRVPFNFEYNQRAGLIQQISNELIKFDSNLNEVLFSETVFDNLDVEYFLLRDKSNYTFIQKSDLDFFYANSHDQKSLYAFDYSSDEFVDFKVDFLNKNYSSNQKVLNLNFQNFKFSKYINALLELDVKGTKFLISDYAYFNNLDPSFYSHLVLDKPKYKLGDKINGTLLIGDFNQELVNNFVDVRLTSGYSSEYSSNNGLIEKQTIQMDSYGASDFSIRIPEFIDGNENFLYLNFYWNGKLVDSQTIEIMKIDKAQTVVTANLDKEFYLPGQNAKLSLNTSLFNGSVKPNVDFVFQNYSNRLLNQDFYEKSFQTNQNGEYVKELQITPDLELYRKMYSPYSDLFFNLRVLDKKGEDSYIYISKPYYLTLLDVNFDNEYTFNANQLELKFNANQVEPGSFDKVGKALANKKFKLKMYFNGSLKKQSFNNPIVEPLMESDKALPDFQEILNQIDPTQIIEINGSDAEDDIILQIDENTPVESAVMVTSEEFTPIEPKNSVVRPRKQEASSSTNFVLGDSSQDFIASISGSMDFQDIFVFETDIQTDANGSFSQTFDIFESLEDFDVFSYFNVEFEIEYLEDEISKSYTKRMSFNPKENDFERFMFKTLEVISVDGKIKPENQEQDQFEAWNYKLGSKIEFQIQDFDQSSKYMLLLADYNGITSQIIKQPNFEFEIGSEHLPNFDMGLIEMTLDGEFVIHNQDSYQFANDFEIKNLNLEKVFSPGGDYELNLEFSDKSIEQAFVNVKMVDKKLYNNSYDYERNVNQSLFNDSYFLSFGNYYGRSNDFGGKGGCFLKDSQILMGDSTTKNIQDIMVGDTVLTYADDKIGSLHKAVVQGVQSFWVDEYYVVNDELFVTPNHQVYVDGEFKSMFLAAKGSQMIKDGKLVNIQTIQKVKTSQPIEVYNFTVGKYHTYIVDGYFVHNEGKGGDMMEMASMKDLRSNFQDVAFFKSFYTNQASVLETFKLPDDITSYKLFVSAFSKDGYKSGFLKDEISTVKDVIVEPLFPSKVNKGDKLNLEFGIYGEKAQEVENAFIEIAGQRNLIENPKSENTFAYDFNETGLIDYTLGAEANDAKDYYQDKIQVRENAIFELSDYVQGLKLKQDMANQLMIVDPVREFTYFSALELLDEIKQIKISDLEYEFTIEYLNKIIRNYNFIPFEPFEPFYQFVNPNSAFLDVVDFKMQDLNDEVFTSLINYLSTSKLNSNILDLNQVDLEFFLQNPMNLRPELRILYFALASDFELFYFNELETLKNQPFYFFAKAYMLNNYNELASNFRVQYLLDNEMFTEFSNNGQVLLEVYKGANFDFDLDLEAQNLNVYTATYQVLDTAYPEFDLDITPISADSFRFKFDMNKYSKEIFADDSFFDFSMILPTGFELLPSEYNWYESKCQEYLWVNGDRIETNLYKYYYEDDNRKPCDLSIEFVLSPMFKGQIVVPPVLLKSNLNKFVTKEFVIDVK